MVIMLYCMFVFLRFCTFSKKLEVFCTWQQNNVDLDTNESSLVAVFYFF